MAWQRVQARAAANAKARAAKTKDGKRQRVDNREEWPAEAGAHRFLAFTLYKENRDTIQAVQELSRLLRVGQNAFGFAGTKDRRGVTTQRVTAFKVPAKKLVEAFARAPFGDQLAVGGLEYVAEPLRLGMLAGNRFTIVLRDVQAPPEQLEAALASLAAKGFVNYFGLQRFGANAEAPTHEVGAALLRSDWHEALRLLLAPRKGEREEESAARALWLRGGDAAAAAAALKLMPRRMHVERALLEGVVAHGPT